MISLSSILFAVETAPILKAYQISLKVPCAVVLQTSVMPKIPNVQDGFTRIRFLNSICYAFRQTLFSSNFIFVKLYFRQTLFSII